eukprot:1157297-Pelagomonas_calceolata.AAC.4
MGQAHGLSASERVHGRAQRLVRVRHKARPGLRTPSSLMLNSTQTCIPASLWQVIYVQHRLGQRSQSPQQGLSQMFRNPETTALVGKLREKVQLLTMERDSLQVQLKDAKMDMRWEWAMCIKEAKRNMSTSDSCSHLLSIGAYHNHAGSRTSVSKWRSMHAGYGGGHDVTLKPYQCAVKE